MFTSWHVLEYRRQLLERVQGIWQRYRRSCMLAEPVEIVQLILDALKGEEACM